MQRDTPAFAIDLPAEFRPAMQPIRLLIAAAVLGLFFESAGLAAEDPLAPWQGAIEIAPVSPQATGHSMHSYFNTCPESPDGKHVLFYTSVTGDGHRGEVRIRERQSGEERVLARDLYVEDAHRVACQQWVSQGRRVVYHAEREGEWVVSCVDIATGKSRDLAVGRLSGWGQPQADFVPLYGPHWKAGEHRDLEILNVETGEIRTVLEHAAVQTDWLTKVAAGRESNIFFPVLSPDLKRVFFKMAIPLGGDPRSSKASQRLGLVCYSLEEQKFLYDSTRWGHPSWHPDSRTIVETSYYLFDSNNGKSRRLPGLPVPKGDHPSASPDGRLIVTDTTMDVFGGEKKRWGIIVADAAGEKHYVIHEFDNSRGASSWRRSHPHPIFSPDGQRIYFNVSQGDYTQLFVATPKGQPTGEPADVKATSTK